MPLPSQWTFTHCLPGVTFNQMKFPLTGIPYVPRSHWSTLLVLGLVMLCTGQMPGQANAQDWDHYRGWEVTEFELTGLPEELAGDFNNQLVLQGSSNLFGSKKPNFKTKLLAEDLARIRLHLARHGYPFAKTNPVVTADLEKRQMSLTIEIDAGQAARVGRLDIDGWPVRVALPDTSRQGIIHQGQIFQDEIIEKAADMLRTILQDSGFESAKVRPSLVGFEAGQIEILFDVDAGLYCVIDSVTVEGCSEDLFGVALRVMDIEPGIEYSAEKMKQSALDLRGIQLFGRVELTTENLESGHLLARATLENARMRSWYAAVGTWSDNPWMVRMGWSHNNFFKRGFGLRTAGEVGAHTVSVGADVFWKGWLTPRSTTSYGFEVIQEKELSYGSFEKRTEIIQAFRPNLRDMWKVGLSMSLVDVELYSPDPDEPPDAQGPMLELWSDMKWDRTDNPIRPTQGHYYKISFTFSPPEGVSEAPYVQLQVDTVRYQPIFGELVLAGRLRLGASQSLGGSEDLISNRRFYAGGYNTMRGYERRHLGPTDSSNDPRGGKFVGLAGLEVRYPLFWLIEGAVFFDAGQVWREYSDVTTGTISGAAGLAVDLITPIGPLRLNYAVNVLHRQEDRPRDMWTFGIGYPW